MNYTLTKNDNGEITLTLTKKFKTTEEAMTILLEIEKATGASSLSKMEVELLAILKGSGLLQAVKHYKDATGQGLRESKDYCDELKLKFIRLNLLEK